MSVGSTVPPGRVDVDRIRAVYAIHDDTTRNLLITQAYADLSRVMGELIGPHASWCTFSTWSSRTIGYFIRGDPDPMLEHQLRRLPRLLRRIARAPLVRLGSYFTTRRSRAAPRLLARGNREIFLEIGCQFATFVATFAGARERDPEQWRRYRDSIVAAPATDVFPAADVDLLADGLECYFEARYETDVRRQAQLVLRGNILLADYEQQRVDPIVRSALSLFPSRLLHDGPGDGALLAVGERKPWALQDTGALRTFVDDVWGWLLTKVRMALVLPAAVALVPEMELIRVGHGLPSPPPGEALYPSRLHSFHDDPELAAVWARHDRSRGLHRGARARNWTKLGDRMNCIVNVFRSRQARRALYDVDPLTPAELRRANNGLESSA